jgi:uncharacterized PurR-regulated membrane protein YhhQ (DUF165 family)
VSIRGYNFAASGLIFSLSFLLASVATEVYGYKLVGRIIWIQMLCQAVFILFVNAVLVSIAYPINLSAQYEMSYIANIAFNTWVYKMMATTLIFPAALVIAAYVKKIEKIDFYDYGGHYNPLLVFRSNLPGKNKYEEKKSEL